MPRPGSQLTANVKAESAVPTPELPRLGLAGNFAWTLAGNLTLAACQWAVVVIIAKLGTPFMVGQFALGLALISPLMLLTNQGLRSIVVTDTDNRLAFKHYAGYRLLSTAILMAALCVFAAFTGHPWVLIGLATAKAFDSISDVLYGLFQHHDRMDISAISMMAKGGLSVIAAAAAMWYAGSVVSITAALATASLIVLAFYDYRRAASIMVGDYRNRKVDDPTLWPAFDRATLAEIASLTVPLGIAALLNSLSANLPRYFLEHFSGTSALGVFAATVYLVTAGNTVVGALAQSSVSRLSRLYAGGETAAIVTLLLRLVGVAAAIGAAGVAISALWGDALLGLLYGSEYSKGQDVLVVGMASAGVSYMAIFLGTALTAVRAIRVQPIIFAGCAVFTALLSMGLISRLGLIGAAWTLVGTAAFQLIAYTAALWVRLRR